VNEKVKYWIELSDYDLETAEAMLESKRFLYVGYMCHQAIEKIFKAYYCLTFDEHPPYSHNLSYLSGKTDLNTLISEEFKEFIDILEPLNTEARYPTDKAMLLKSLTKSKCESILVKTKKLQVWVKERL